MLNTLEKFEKFTVLLAVYHGDDCVLFDKALNSIYENSQVPDQVVLVIDGPICDSLEVIVDRYIERGVEPVWLPENKGLAHALNEGLKHCRHTLVARCDADDINLHKRFEIQLFQFSKNPELKVLGGQIVEKNGGVDYSRTVPLEHKEAKRFLKLRNPFNHMTVMFQKQAVIDAGGYPIIPFREDYALWAKLISLNHQVGNVSDKLVEVSGGADMYRRRGTPSHIRYEIMLQRHLLACGHVSRALATINLVLRSCNMMIPSALRAFFYKAVLRQKIKDNSQ